MQSVSKSILFCTSEGQRRESVGKRRLEIKGGKVEGGYWTLKRGRKRKRNLGGQCLRHIMVSISTFR
jgi:hypothetical protein